MPEILVRANLPSDTGDVMLRERIIPADLESEHFSAQLVERIGWALADADAAEQRSDDPRPYDPTQWSSGSA